MISVLTVVTKNLAVVGVLAWAGPSHSGPCTATGPVLKPTLAETVDLIELNHFYDDLGRHSYDQVIFYEWSPDYSRYHVISWCLLEKNPGRRPQRDAHRDQYVVRWHDREAKTQREVRSKLFRETWSQVDPERANKKLLDEKYRVSLIKANKERPPAGILVRTR